MYLVCAVNYLLLFRKYGASKKNALRKPFSEQWSTSWSQYYIDRRKGERTQSRNGTINIDANWSLLRTCGTYRCAWIDLHCLVCYRGFRFLLLAARKRTSRLFHAAQLAVPVPWFDDIQRSSEENWSEQIKWHRNFSATDLMLSPLLMRLTLWSENNRVKWKQMSFFLDDF